ncbi:MAG TPA: YDG domain-containing protein [Candidatus Sulfotelmatobacter sp.]|jgi:hypothetical protein|nr:YDG domain-containing protein [Candidatus Sulfotelmatobacter sp.]
MNGKLFIWASIILIGCGELFCTRAANVVVVNAIAQAKSYDGTTAATVNFSGAILVGVSNADLGNVTLVTNGYLATFDDQYVDSGKTVTVSGLTLAGSAAGNYTLTQPVLYADINPLPLTITATGVNKTYNGNTNASVTLSNNHLAGDSVTAYYTTAGFADKNIGTNKVVTVYSLIIAGADADSYTLTNSTVATTANISSKVLHVAATGVNKPYDGTTAATVMLTDNHVIGDSITDTYTNAVFSSPYVGSGITISVSGIAVGGTDAVNYSLAANTATAQANITTRTLNVTATGQNKTYDGTTNATATLSDDRISGDDITVTFNSAGFAGKNAGTNETVSVNGIVLTGPDSDSYTLATNVVATTANISSRTLTVVASGVNKTYDGTTNATVTLSDNRIAGDNLTNNYSAAGFSDKNVGNGKTVTVTGLWLTGSDAINYSPGNTTATTPANITGRTLIVTATGVNKTYDGTTNATVNLSDNRISGDVFTDTYGSAAFSSSAVGPGITVNLTGIQITGTDSQNYNLSNTSATATANITGRALSVAATGVDKIYDATTTASVTLSDNRLSGDSLTVNYGGVNFISKTVGSGKSITVSNLTLSGTSAGNYYLAATNITATANITVRPLAVTATGVNKTYDGTTATTATLADNRLVGDVFTDTYGSAAFSSSAVGNGKTITVTGIYVAGTDAGNYSLTNTTATTTANILAAVSGLAFNSSVNPAGYLGNVTFTATLPSDATGTVTLFTNGVSFASGAPGSGAFAASLASLPRATNLVTAIYSGDANYAAATNSLSEIITNHPPQTGYFTFSVTNGISLKVSLSSLLTATVDPDGDAVSLVNVSSTSTNGMPIATNSTLLLFRNTNYVNDSFSYVVKDNYGGFATGQVYVASVIAPFTGQNTTLFTGGSSNLLTFHGIPDYSYVVQRSVNLLTWKSISTNTAGNTGAINYMDTFADLSGPPSSAFYRLLWQPN